MTTQNKVEQIEKKYDVASVVVKRYGKTFQVYPWIKGRLFHKMITGAETMQRRNFQLYWKQFTSIFYGLHNIFRSYDIWAFTNSVERRAVDGAYHDKIVDFIGNESGYKTLVVEQRLFQYIPYSKIASRYAMSRSFFLLFEIIYGRFFLRKIEVINPDIMHAIIADVSGSIHHKAIVRKYLAQYRLMKFWLRVLKHPKLVFVSVSYMNFGYIRALKEAGIKVIELQHGIISKNHHAYFYATKMDENQFPDALITLGDKEMEVFDDDNAFPLKSIKPLGSWIIDHYRNKPKTRFSDKPTILFTLQDGLMSELLIPFILDLNDELKDSYEIRVQPRRTPKSVYLEKFPKLEQIEFSDRHFYEAINAVEVHSTVYSTTAIESLSFGVPNILVNLENQSLEQLGDALGENPFTKIVDSTKAFIDALKELDGAEAEEIAQSNSYHIKEGYERNVLKYVKSLMQN